MHSRPASVKSATFTNGTASKENARTPDPLAQVADPDHVTHCDCQLIGEFVRGQEDAATTLFHRYWSVVCRIARRIIGDDGEAEETTQQVFLEVFRNISQFDPGKGEFRAWLFSKTKYRAINRREHLETRRFYSSTEVDEGGVLPDVSDSTLQLSRQEVTFLIGQLLSKLPAEQNEVIRLVYFEGLTTKEAATRTGKTVRAVRYSLSKACKLLRTWCPRRTAPVRSG
jgi:RNA polymerase sigma-70 factor, ECF subfamily